MNAESGGGALLLSRPWWSRRLHRQSAPRKIEKDIQIEDIREREKKKKNKTRARHVLVYGSAAPTHALLKDKDKGYKYVG